MAKRKNTRAPRARSPKFPLPISELSESINRLEAVLATITIAAAALRLQGAEVDGEVATALRRCAADPLGREIERLVAFIGRVRS